MPLLFCDSFNHYNNLADKWDFVGNAVISNLAARTGLQSCQVVGGSSGPKKILGQQQLATEYTHLLIGFALQANAIDNNSALLNLEKVAPSFVSTSLILQLNTDGSIAVIRGAGTTGQTTLGTTAPGTFVFTADWNYIECKWAGSDTNGFVEVRVAAPGQPMKVAITISGVRTSAFVGDNTINSMRLEIAAGASHNCFFADFYMLDWSNPALPNSDYLGGVKIYYTVPFANGAPVQWTPLAGTNFQEVNDVPPDGDTSYNSSGIVGQIDAYQHNASGVPANSSIPAVQHIIDARTDAGARGLCSVVNGVAHANSVFIAGTYSMYTYQYDTNPATHAAWKGSDFPSTFGPEVTA